jgi:TadE-like protein
MTKAAIQFFIKTHTHLRRSAERGQSMVEFSLLLLPFLIVTIGTIEVGRAWSVKQAVTNAAREGARVLLLPYGADQSCPDVDCSSAESLQDAALTATRRFLNNAGVIPDAPTTEITLIRQRLQPNGAITTEPMSGAMNTGDLVGVQIKHHYTSLIQGFFAGDNTTIKLLGVSVMRHE